MFLLIKRIGFVFLTLFILSSCSAKKEPDLSIRSAIDQYFFNGISSKEAQGFTQGFHLSGKDNARALADRFIEESVAEVSTVFSKRLGGKKPAKINVLFKNISIASGIGRTLLKSDSRINATVTIHDAANNTVIASRSFHSVDRAAKLRGNIGVFIGVAINATSAPEEKRLARIREAFVQDVAEWMKGN